MSDNRPQVQVPSDPSVVDIVELRDVEFPLPGADEAWHRKGLPQPCRAHLKIFFSSIAASAESDNVGLTLDYGRLYRQLKANVEHSQSSECPLSARVRALRGVNATPLEEVLVHDKQDVRFTAGMLATSALDLLLDSAASTKGEINSTPAIRSDFGRCEVSLHLPKAVLRADQGLHYRSLTSLSQDESGYVVLEEEVQIKGMRCYCVVGINPHERREKQAVTVNLRFNGTGNAGWASTVMASYQEMTRVITEEVEASSFGSVEALATLVAKVATVQFGHEVVTVRLEKTHALAFAGGSGLEITRSKEFFGGV